MAVSMPPLPLPASYFIDRLRPLGLAIRDAVGHGLRHSELEELAAPVAERGGDTIYGLDEHAEQALLAACERWGAEVPFLLVAEGLERGWRRFPADGPEEDTAFTLIVDPVDGTRGLMYGKRSAWGLLAIAPAPAPDAWPTLADIAVALQVELPTTRAALADVLWAVRGCGVRAETHDLRTGEITPFVPRPSRALSLEGGFATVAKFFPGAKVSAARLEEELFRAVAEPAVEAPAVFDDEYICSGGQLYELVVGHDRFTADLRPVLPGSAGSPVGPFAHPYDLCTALIATEAGVIVTDHTGGVLSVPLDTQTPVAWVGYANTALQHRIQPVLLEILRRL